MAEGIVAGGGSALLHAASVLDELNVGKDYAIGVEIVRRALTEPTYLIAKPFLPETVQATVGQALFFHPVAKQAA